MKKKKQRAARGGGKAVSRRIGDRVTIFKDPRSPNWYMRYSIPGVRKQVKITLDTKSLKRAEAKAKKKDAELVLGIAQAPTAAAKIGKAIELYIGALELQERAPGTLDGYRRDLEQFRAYAETRGVARLDRISSQLLREFHLRLKNEGMKGIVPQRKKGRRLTPNKGKTIRNKMKTIRQLLKWALADKMLREDPASGYRLPPEPKDPGFCWGADEHRLIRTHADPEWLDIFDFLAMTGLRSDELCWLLKTDIVFGDRPYIHVRIKTCPQIGIRWQPKHGRQRIVPLCSQAAEIARRAYDASPGPWLFWSDKAMGKQAGHRHPDATWRALRKTLDKAGIKRGTVHTFRHLFCSFMANNKVPPFQVQKILGHGTLDIVLRYYHVSDDELLRALDHLPFEKLQQTEPKQEGGSTRSRQE